MKFQNVQYKDIEMEKSVILTRLHTPSTLLRNDNFTPPSTNCP